MRVLCSLIGFVFFTLQDAASIIIYPQTEGGDLTVECSFTFRGSRKWFCRKECEEENILVRTDGDTAHKGRYSIKYEARGLGGKLLVTITQLTKADSGLYTCALFGFLQDPQQFQIIVVDAMLVEYPPVGKTLYAGSGGNIVVECAFFRTDNRKYFCRDDCQKDDILIETTSVFEVKSRYILSYAKGVGTQGFLFVSISQLTTSDSGRYRCGVGRPPSLVYREFEVVVTDVSSASTPTTMQVFNFAADQQPGTTPPADSLSDVWLAVGLTLAILLVLLSLAVIIYRKSSSKAKGVKVTLDPVAVEAEDPSVAEADRTYENIGEAKRRRSPPVAVSHAEYSGPHRTVAEDASEMTAAADTTRLTYSQLKFSRSGAGSLGGTVRGDADTVVYSAPRIEVNSDPPVYSSVT